MGYLKAATLLAGLTAIFVFFGLFVGGEFGAVVAFFIALGVNVFAYWNSDKIILRMYSALEISKESDNGLYGQVDQLAKNAEIPMPKLYVIENDQPNAFATGRNPQHGAVAVTTGLLHRLNDDELGAVIAHELAHIKNRDTLIMTITATIAGAISSLAFFGVGRGRGGNPIMMIVMSILAPLVAMLVQMAISRTREYAADRVGAEICGNPMALASALEKIASNAAQIDNMDAENNPATAHMFIINPLHTKSIDSLFSTHPNTQNRIKALHEMIK